MAADASSKRQRVYEAWQGGEKFFCGGRLVAGPNWRASIGTAALLLAPTGIFLAFVAPYVMRELHAVIMVFSCLLPALSGLYLFLTACRDPGVIPRQEPDDEYLQGRKPRTKEVLVNNHRVVIRYNDTCHFYQPPRAHHCSVNDNCIERFDHHCPWVGTTIGRRNYRTFLLFIATATVLCLYVFGVCLTQLFLKHNELVRDAQAQGEDGSGLWPKTLRSVIPALALMAYTFLFFWFVGGLSGFHCYLVGTNQTTYENFRYNHDNRPNPYNLGLIKNCAEVWCTPVPPSQVDFRAFVDEARAGQYAATADGMQQCPANNVPPTFEQQPLSSVPPQQQQFVPQGMQGMHMALQQQQREAVIQMQELQQQEQQGWKVVQQQQALQQHHDNPLHDMQYAGLQSGQQVQLAQGTFTAVQAPQGVPANAAARGMAGVQQDSAWSPAVAAPGQHQG